MNRLKLARRDWENRVIRTVHAGRGLQASVYLIEQDGELWAVKDYANAPAQFRNGVAPVLVARECRALRHLDGTAGIPQFHGKLDALSFAMQYIEAKPLDHFHPGEVAAPIFAHIEAVIAAMHAQGVAHGDLKRRSNILITPDEQIYLVDFAAAVVARGALSTRLMRALAEIDDKSVPRLKRLVAPEFLTEEDKWKLANPTTLERWARRLLKR